MMIPRLQSELYQSWVQSRFSLSCALRCALKWGHGTLRTLGSYIRPGEDHVDVFIVVHSVGCLLAPRAAGVGFVSLGMAFALAVPNLGDRSGRSPGVAEGHSFPACARATRPQPQLRIITVQKKWMRLRC